MAVYRTFSLVKKSYDDQAHHQLDYFSSIEKARDYGRSSDLINVKRISLMKPSINTKRFYEIQYENDEKEVIPFENLTRLELIMQPKFIYLFINSDIDASRDKLGTMAYIDEESLLRGSIDFYDTWKSIIERSKSLRETYDQYVMLDEVMRGNLNTFEEIFNEISSPEGFKETYIEKYEIDKPGNNELMKYNFSSKEKMFSVYELGKTYVNFLIVE
uniref:Uncharacterized protein n=1 Tax=Pithovirus LCPAC401 TaxID=2506595 RepID=A0A481ZAM6_9VIRU|nr:MAG: hypothetical protein LCPAC401_01630 [Pithovirus LCPAC401]